VSCLGGRHFRGVLHLLRDLGLLEDDRFGGGFWGRSGFLSRGGGLNLDHGLDGWDGWDDGHLDSGDGWSHRQVGTGNAVTVLVGHVFVLLESAVGVDVRVCTFGQTVGVLNLGFAGESVVVTVGVLSVFVLRVVLALDRADYGGGSCVVTAVVLWTAEV